MRELALTRLSCGGSTRGTAAARVTPYAFDATRQPRAAGNSATVSPVPTASARTQHRNARVAIVAPIAHRRPWLNRSRNGPISGATIANGSIVRPRKSATWPRAWSVGTWKNNVPASEIATAASPAPLNACSSISRESPVSPAPSAWVARRACRTVNPAARPVAPATRRLPSATRRPPSAKAWRRVARGCSSVSSATPGSPGLLSSGAMPPSCLAARTGNA